VWGLSSDAFTPRLILNSLGAEAVGVRLLHTADWQIGKQFSWIEGDAGALVRTQRLETIRRLASLAREREVDAVLVAGDVFEMNTVSDETLRRTVDVLSGYTGPWLLLPGNHDAALQESAWTRLSRIGVPDNVRLLVTPEPVTLKNGAMAVLPAPLTRRHEARDLTEGFGTIQTPEGAIRVGLAHGSVENRLPDVAELHNPISDRRAAEARLDYLALGDWHGTLQIADRTWYAGTHETDGFRENDSGNALIVELEGPGTPPRVEKIPTTHYRWSRMSQEVHGPDGLKLLEGDMYALEQPWDRHILSLDLRGALDLAGHGALQGILDTWRARLRYLRTEQSAMVVAPSDEDLDRLGASGFVSRAVQQLREMADDTGKPDSAHASAALQRLYVEYMALTGRG
jgi:DNA repair exonuclease SbcCD nuclease subunit